MPCPAPIVRLSALLLTPIVAVLLAACGDDRDETVPALTVDPVVSPRNDPAVDLSGTREAGAGIEVEVDTSATVGVPDLLDPILWTVRVSDLVEGTNTISMTATDSAGNIHLIRMAIVFDQTAPLVEVAPAENALDVPLDAKVVATFNEPLKEGAISATSFHLFLGDAPVEASVSYDELTREATLAPTGLLLPGSTYEVLLSPSDNPVTDLAGNPLVEKTWTFMTAAQ